MKKTFVNFYHLLRPFWGARNNWASWVAIITAILLGFTVIYLNVLINDWSKSFYDALGNFEHDKLYALMREYAIYITIYLVVYVYQDWFMKLVTIRWRKAMTDELVDSWFAKRAFYRLSLNGKTDNPDQRIAEDIHLFVTKSIELFVSFLVNFAQVSTFLVILWNLSGVHQFTLWGTTITIHGYLVWAAVIYVLTGSLITHLIGHKLHAINYTRQRVEANFRASLLRKHDNAEQIALYHGEQQEKHFLHQHFTDIRHNWRELMDRERNLGFFTTGYTRVSLIVPIFAAMPLFLAKTITLGGLMQIRSAFNQVYNALNWFVRAYRLLMEWTATIERLDQFKKAIALAQHEQHQPQAAPALTIEKLSLTTPLGQPLLDNISLECAPGKWHRFAGESGLGKSTLLRTLSGLWPYYQGTWHVQAGTSLLLPQQSYLGQGTFAELLCYPQAPTTSAADLIAILHQVGLSDWATRLDETRIWDRVFSGGERQRLAFARVLINRPDTIYLDEATSNLDAATATELLMLLKTALPNSTVIAITHQNSLMPLFDETHDLSVFKHKETV